VLKPLRQELCETSFLRSAMALICMIAKMVIIRNMQGVADTLWSVHTLHETPTCQESTMQNNTLSL